VQVIDQWKERKKLQSTIDGQKVKLRELLDQIQEEERLKDNLRKTLNRLINEKRTLEDKLKLKGLLKRFKKYNLQLLSSIMKICFHSTR